MRNDDSFRLRDEHVAAAALVFICFLAWLVLTLERVA